LAEDDPFGSLPLSTRECGCASDPVERVLHELHLVDAELQKKSRKIGKRFFAQITPPIEIVPAGPIAVGKMAFVRRDISGETACNRPDATGIQTPEKSRMGYQSCDASIAVEERMYPQQAVMRRGSR
jgi:hypothetical protein